MAPPKGKKNPKKLSSKISELFGIPVEQIEEAKKKTRRTEDAILEAEGVLIYFRLKGEGFTRQTCPQCGRMFAYKYTTSDAQLCCSNECRKASLAAVGIDWDASKTPEERWGFRMFGGLPAVVPPEVLPYADAVLDETRKPSDDGPISADSLLAELGLT